MKAIRTLLAALGLFAYLLLPGQVLADEADVTVHVVQASKKAGPTDPALERFRSQFGDFAYKSYKLLAVRKAKVTKGKPATVDLAGGKKLTLDLRSVDKAGRAKLKLSIPGVVETTVAVRKGGDVVLGGPAMPHGDGVLFVPVTVEKVKQ